MARRSRRSRSSFRPAQSGTARSSTWVSRLFFLVGLGGIAALLSGFIWFGDHVSGLRAPLNLAAADGAAALTGGSDARLKAGVALVERRIVPRLLISGVNVAATPNEVRLVAGGNPQTYACCIDLGKAAIDTVSNATEVSDWVARYRVKRLILITDNYHMPRSLFEVRRANPDVTIVPYPVVVDIYADKNWWKNERATRGLALEYGKYLVAIGRAYFGGLLGTKTA
jgi:uncharacterized SAM-binding protein YcdF (DUF218 family)